MKSYLGGRKRTGALNFLIIIFLRNKDFKIIWKQIYEKACS